MNLRAFTAVAKNYEMHKFSVSPEICRFCASKFGAMEKEKNRADLSWIDVFRVSGKYTGRMQNNKLLRLRLDESTRNDCGLLMRFIARRPWCGTLGLSPCGMSCSRLRWPVEDTDHWLDEWRVGAVEGGGR